jgi:hypothetical protein
MNVALTVEQCCGFLNVHDSRLGGGYEPVKLGDCR